MRVKLHRALLVGLFVVSLVALRCNGDDGSGSTDATGDTAADTGAETTAETTEETTEDTVAETTDTAVETTEETAEETIEDTGVETAEETIEDTVDPPPTLTNSHSGWHQPDCTQCHDSEGHRVDLLPHNCVGCHGDNGAPSGHGRSGPCGGCHPNKHGDGATFPDPEACLTCH